jgi:hypothetical protein
MASQSLWHLDHLRHFLAERSRLGKYFGYFVVVAVCVEFARPYITDSVSWDAVIDRVTITLGFFILLFVSLKREFDFERRGRYVHSLGRIEKFALILKNLNTYLSEHIKIPPENPNQVHKLVKDQFVASLDEVSELLSLVSDSVCRTTIKCMSSERDKLFVYALARDSKSGAENEINDRKRYDTHADLLEENEDFHSIFSEGAQFYIKNDLPRRIDYRNSSFKLYGERPKELNWFQRAFMPRTGWTLPYKSAMVFPIQQKSSAILEFEAVGCIGFLTIDSPRRKGFDHRFDGPLGLALANALFSALNQYGLMLGRPAA